MARKSSGRLLVFTVAWALACMKHHTEHQVHFPVHHNAAGLGIKWNNFLHHNTAEQEFPHFKLKNVDFRQIV